MDEPPRVLIVEARYYEDLADWLLEGAKAALDEVSAETTVITVPGALEIPAAIGFAHEAGHRSIGVRYDGYVALGCVIRGETHHFDIVANESARALMDMSVNYKLALGNGILTVENEMQAQARADPTALDKGGDAARACLAMIALRKRISGARETAITLCVSGMSGAMALSSVVLPDSDSPTMVNP